MERVLFDSFNQSRFFLACFFNSSISNLSLSNWKKKEITIIIKSHVPFVIEVVLKAFSSFFKLPCLEQLQSQIEHSYRSFLWSANEGKKPSEWQCEHCNKGFDGEENFKRYIKLVHEGKKPYECEQCQKDLIKKKTSKDILNISTLDFWSFLLHQILYSNVHMYKVPLLHEPIQ